MLDRRGRNRKLVAVSEVENKLELINNQLLHNCFFLSSNNQFKNENSPLIDDEHIHMPPFSSDVTLRKRLTSQSTTETKRLPACFTSRLKQTNNTSLFTFQKSLTSFLSFLFDSLYLPQYILFLLLFSSTRLHSGAKYLWYFSLFTLQITFCVRAKVINLFYQKLDKNLADVENLNTGHDYWSLLLSIH